MYNSPLYLAVMNLIWRYQEWRRRPTDIYVDLTRINLIRGYGRD